MTDQVFDTNNLQNQAAAPRQAQPNAFILSRNPNRALQEMMETIDSLRTVYEEETRALQMSDTTQFRALLDRKLKIASRYQAGAEQMLERREEFKQADPELRNKLLKAHDEFSTLATTNLDALDRTRTALQRLGSRIMGAARETVCKESVNYSANGSLSGQNRAVSIGLNESA